MAPFATPRGNGRTAGGLELFLEFAVEVGAIGKTKRDELAQRSLRALDEVLARQAKFHRASDPASYFLTLLEAAIISGHAHIAGRRAAEVGQYSVRGWPPLQSSRGTSVIGK